MRTLLRGTARLPGRVPATLTYLGLVVVASSGLAVLHDHDRAAAHALLVATSTNIEQLSSHPVRALAVSALWVHRRAMASAIGAIAASAGVLEWRHGSKAAVGTFATGHIGGSLLVAAGLWTGLHLGWVDESVRDAIDVGVSYGCAACLVAWLVASRYRVAQVAAVAFGCYLLARAVGGDFTDAGHLVSSGLGAGAGLLIRRFGRPARAPRGPARAPAPPAAPPA